jgi:hypothetical protein
MNDLLWSVKKYFSFPSLAAEGFQFWNGGFCKFHSVPSVVLTVL